MDSIQRVTARRGPQELAQVSARRAQTTPETQLAVSDDRSVQGERAGVVAGVSADRRASLGQYRNLLSGSSLPTMTQLMSAEEARENVARKALSQTAESEESAKAAEALPSKDESASATDTSEVGETDAKSDQKPLEDPSKAKSPTGEELSQEDQREVEQLKARDREVRAHEQAHVAAGGQYVRGGISYDYQRGPDGQNYAVGGHVNIDVSAEKTPEATITKMQQVKRAALAPAEPSGADRAVAAEAAQKEQAARGELLESRQKEAENRRSEAVKESKSTRPAKAIEGAEGAESVEGVEGVEGAASQVEASPAESSNDIQLSDKAPEASQPREHMNLAREARMRIKRGITWLA